MEGKKMRKTGEKVMWKSRQININISTVSCVSSARQIVDERCDANNGIKMKINNNNNNMCLVSLVIFRVRTMTTVSAVVLTLIRIPFIKYLYVKILMKSNHALMHAYTYYKLSKHIYSWRSLRTCDGIWYRHTHTSHLTTPQHITRE